MNTDVGNLNLRPCSVAPLEAFSDEIADDKAAERFHQRPCPGKGPDSEGVAFVFDSNCCGWETPPTSAEFYEALRAETPNTRQRTILGTWILEATIGDWLRAWAEQVYSWRMLARAVMVAGPPVYHKIRILNTYAKRQDLVPADALPVDRMPVP